MAFVSSTASVQSIHSIHFPHISSARISLGLSCILERTALVSALGTAMFTRSNLRLILVAAVLCPLSAAPIDLNDFFADPTVTVAPDGSSAILGEDPGLGSVLLANDPGLGDPNVIVPALGVAVFFDFDFSEGAGEADEFGAFVVDAATGLSAGPLFEFFTQTTSNGTVSFDLSPLVGMTLGLQFQLTALPGDAGLSSTVTVAQVRLEPVPEAPAAILFTSGTLLACFFRGKRFG